MNTFIAIEEAYAALNRIRIRHGMTTISLAVNWTTVRKPKRDAIGDYYHLVFKQMPKKMQFGEDMQD